VELIETFGSSNNNNDDKENAPFQVTITGEWFLKPETNPFTGAPMTAIQFELDKVKYGPQTNNANDWDSLGPIKLVDILYLSKDVLITRANVNVDSLFVWERIK
jgi:hypothetical protein